MTRNNEEKLPGLVVCDQHTADRGRPARRRPRVLLARDTSQAEGRPVIAAASAYSRLDFSMFRHLQGIIDLNSEVSYRAFELFMPKKQLNGPEVLGAPVDQSGLGAP